MSKQKLSEKDTTRLEECKALLKDAKFEPMGDFEKCTEEHVAPILALVAGLDIVKSRVKVLVLQCLKPTTLPVTKGESVDLIPTNITTPNAAVSGEKLELGCYVHLTEDGNVEPGFQCVCLRVSSTR